MEWLRVFTIIDSSGDTEYCAKASFHMHKKWNFLWTVEPYHLKNGTTLQRRNVLILPNAVKLDSIIIGKQNNQSILTSDFAKSICRFF